MRNSIFQSGLTVSAQVDLSEKAAREVLSEIDLLNLDKINQECMHLKQRAESLKKQIISVNHEIKELDNMIELCNWLNFAKFITVLLVSYPTSGLILGLLTRLGSNFVFTAIEERFIIFMIGKTKQGFEQEKSQKEHQLNELYEQLKIIQKEMEQSIAIQKKILDRLEFEISKVPPRQSGQNLIDSEIESKKLCRK